MSPCARTVDLVRGDVLRDATGLAGRDARLADRVEQRRLAVVDVTHDGDDRRARRRACSASSAFCAKTSSSLKATFWTS